MRPLCGLSEACLLSSYGLPKATLGILDRLQRFSAAGRPVAASLWPVRSLPPLFLWASEGDVRHFGPPSNAPRQLAGLLRPLCGLSEACLLSSYGLPKATLGILDRLQTLLGSWQACCGLSVACPNLPPLFLWASEGDVRHFGPPSNPRPRLQTLPSAFGLLLHRRPASSADSCIAGLPLLFLWASKSDVRHFAPPSNPPLRLQTLRSAFKPSPPLSAAGRPVAASLWPVRSLPPLFLWASEGDVRHFGPPSNAPRQLAGLLRPLCGLSKACLLSRQLAGLLRPLCGLSEACLLSSYGLPKATLGILDRLQTLLGSWQACCGLSVACPKPASSLLMGFRRRR